ncbi:MAG: penicillin-binding protein 2 [Candidatus Nealsonbacteria bacterium]|nr:penicillin-binding protein 2 [Candidatus Nealsonbacteria bacterium]
MRQWRINLIFILIILFGAAIIGRLVYIQIINYNLYRALAQGQQGIFQPFKGARGQIFFKGGEVLAMNMEGFFRKYPQESMASQTIGFLGGEGRGQYGLEGYYDEVLQGKEGFQEVGLNHNKGADIFLTIDYNIQFTAEELLKKAKDGLDIESGQIVVLEPFSGKILALANFPNFNPNYYFEIKDFQIFQNPVVQKIFEPGSVFKPITAAAAIDQQKINPQTTYIDTGSMRIGGRVISNYDKKVWGEKNMTEVLERSINTGAVFMERELGHNLFLEYLDRFGFFEPTGIDLQGEIFSTNKEFKKGYEINFATASFGQGIEMTPIQLVRAFSVIANAGKMVKPYMVEKIVENGETMEISPALFPKEIISQKTASQVTAMLISVIEQGSGRLAKIPGYYVAGKTGTAQVPEGRGYSAEKTIQSFIGFAPALEPRFLILVKLDNPKARTAEYSAVPIFQELAKYIINYWQIPPDYE